MRICRSGLRGNRLGVRGKKTSLSLDDVRKAFRGVHCSRFYIGDIDENYRANAWNKMRMVCDAHEIFALYDNATLLCHGEVGFAITSNGLYARNYWREPAFIAWHDVKTASGDFPDLEVNGHSVNVCKASEDVIGAMAAGISKLAARHLELRESGDVLVHLDERRLPSRKKQVHPHVVAYENVMMLKPDAGYVWVDRADSRSLSVVWRPRSKHPLIPHVVAAERAGYWRPARGYVWDGARKVKSADRGRLHEKQLSCHGNRECLEI